LVLSENSKITRNVRQTASQIAGFVGTEDTAFKILLTRVSRTAFRDV
jgi:hypothetical protein